MEIDRPIAIAVLLFIILGVGFYIVAPKYQEFKNIQLELSKKEAEFSGKSKYFSEITKIDKELKKYEESLEKIDSALPPDHSLPALIYLLQEKSYESGLILQGVSFLRTSPITQGSRIKTSLFSLELFGSYFAFRNFLSSLEKSSRLIEVENISLSAGKGTQETYPFRLTIKVHSY